MNELRQAVLPRPWLGLSGGDRWAIDAALALQAAGWKTTIWTSRHVRAEAAFPETLDGRVPIEVRAETKRAAGLWDRCRVWRMIFRQRALLKAMKREGQNPQLVVCDVLPHVVPLARRLWPAATVLVYCHYPDKLMASAGGWLYRLYRVPLDSLERRGLAAADCLVANSRFTAAAIRAAFPSLANHGLPVVYPGVGLPSLPARCDQASGERVFLTVSRFDPRKGLALAVESFAALRTHLTAEEFARCRLVMAGGYDDQLGEVRMVFAALRRQAECAGVAAQVEFHLNVNGEALEHLWSRAFAVVHPMDGEHFGIVPVEAMMRGLPVLAVNRGGPCETIVDGATGALRPAEAEAFARVMAEWFQAPGKARVWGAAGERRAKACFSHESFSEKLMAAVDVAVARRALR